MISGPNADHNIEAAAWLAELTKATSKSVMHPDFNELIIDKIADGFELLLADRNLEQIIWRMTLAPKYFNVNKTHRLPVFTTMLVLTMKFQEELKPQRVFIAKQMLLECKTEEDKWAVNKAVQFCFTGGLKDLGESN